MKLCNHFNSKDIFPKKFEKLISKKDFDESDIFSYITACTKEILAVAKKIYPDNEVIFINPVFIINNKIFPSDNVTKDHNMLKALASFLSLANSNTVLPISFPISQNKLSGVCLTSSNNETKSTIRMTDYESFKRFDLNQIKTKIQFVDDEINEQYLIAKLKSIKINTSNSSADFHAFAEGIKIKDDNKKNQLKKSLIFFKNISHFFGDTLTYSFVNKYNKIHSFFDCLFTIISIHPFTEDELFDFAITIENMASPVADYFHKNFSNDQYNKKVVELLFKYRGTRDN